MTNRADAMTYSEIGSYFWLESAAPGGGDPCAWLPRVADSTFTFSGRASIELALRDILANRQARRVYVPSYCCISMLQPFLNHGLEIRYYDVCFSGGEFHYEIDVHHGCDIVLIMNYFGAGVDRTHRMIEALRGGGATIVEDITHSLMGSEVYSAGSDYLVASLRKWFATPAGGWMGKLHGALSVKPNLPSDAEIDGKIRGMREKAAYMRGEIDGKEGFLRTNAAFEDALLQADRMLKIDATSLAVLRSIDPERIRSRRRRNAEALLRGLREMDGAALALPDFDLERETPLFLPIFLAEGERDLLRRRLIEASVYCPVHWPEIPGAPLSVRANELSLVCDQRYSEGDMNATVALIRQWVRDRAK